MCTNLASNLGERHGRLLTFRRVAYGLGPFMMISARANVEGQPQLQSYMYQPVSLRPSGLHSTVWSIECSQGRGVTPAAMEARQPGTYRRPNPPGAINWVDRLNGDAGGTGRAGKQVWGQLLST